MPKDAIMNGVIEREKADTSLSADPELDMYRRCTVSVFNLDLARNGEATEESTRKKLETNSVLRSKK